MAQDRRELQPRRRRRERVRRTFDQSVPSPCVCVCALDAEDRFCLGCLRSLEEIRDWPIMSREEKLLVLAALEVRRKEGTGSS